MLMTFVALGMSALAAETPQPGASAALNLTPHATYRELDGLKFRQLSFGGKEVIATYEPPAGWQTSSRHASELKLYPPQAVQADATVEALPSGGLVRTDVEGIEQLKQEMLGMLPAGSEEITFASVEASPLRVANRETCEVIADFVSFSQRFRMSVLFVDLGPVRLRFRLSARPRDFQPLHNTFRTSLYSWQATVLRPLLLESSVAATGARADTASSSATTRAAVAFRFGPPRLRVAPRL